jgi:hypothetical protein
VSHRILCQGLALIADLPGITATVVAAGVSILVTRRIYVLISVNGGSPSRQEMGNGHLLRVDGSGSCSRMYLALMSIATSS